MLRAGLLSVTDSPIAWRDIAAKLQPYIARRVPATEVDDVLQDVLLRIHHGLGALHDEERFTSWMFRIAGNAIAERGRDRGRHPLAASPEIADAPDDPPDARAADETLAPCLAVFVSRLASPYCEAVTLVELEGKTTREAADIAGISVSGMKSRVQRGRAQLRAMLEACCEIAIDARGGVTDVQPRGLEACCPPTARRD